MTEQQLLAELLADTNFEDRTITQVEASEGGGYAIGCDGLWFAGAPKPWPFEPKPGMTARYFPGGLGSQVHGLCVDGRVIFYKTVAEREAERAAWLADYEEKKRKRALESKLPEKQIESFEWTNDMNEISGFGGGYERTCRAMVSAGCAFLAEHPDLDPQFHGYKGIYGVISDDNDAAKQLSAVVLKAANNDCSGAMHQACIGHILAWKRMGSWIAYQAEMRRPHKDED